MAVDLKPNLRGGRKRFEGDDQSMRDKLRLGDG